MVDDYEDKKLSEAEEKALVEQMLKRFGIAQEAWRDVFAKSNQDIAFVDEDEGQWDTDSKERRKNRPCMTFDKLSGAVDIVKGQTLKNLPGMKVVGAEDDDEDTAEIHEGLIRQIESRTDAYATSFEFTVKGGYGAWRIRHDYLEDTAFYQDIIIDEVKNPFCVLVDPIVQTSPLEKMKYGFVFEDVPTEDFREEWPNAKDEPSGDDFAIEGTRQTWLQEEKIRVVDYYRLVPEETEIALLQNRQVIDLSDERYADVLDQIEPMIVGRRKTTINRLEHYKMTGMEVLEQYRCVGRFVPLVVEFGKTSMVDGKFMTRGLVRKGRDAQKAYNMMRSNHIEVTALQPKQPYIGTMDMIPEGGEDQIKRMEIDNDPILFFEADPKVEGGLPRRQAPPQASSGLVQEIQMAADDIKSTTTIFDASRGAQSNETSGKAIRARQAQGDTANYEFIDELKTALHYNWKVILDMIPHIYDTERSIRILGENNAEKVVTINEQVPNYVVGGSVTINDLSRGRYDLRVKTGPSYATRREETSDQLGNILGQQPALFGVMGDIYLDSLDIVGADEVIERVRMLGIQKGIIEPTEEERQKLAQKNTPEKQMMKKLKDQLTQLEVQEKQAKIGETTSKTRLNNAKAIAEQLEIAITQQDRQGEMIAMQRLLQVLGGRPALPVAAAAM